MAVSTVRRQGNRPGLTLMELVVVMVILIALAAVVLPQLPNLLGRAHSATAATNIAEINKWVMTYQGLYLQLPDGPDALIVGSAAAPYLPQDPATAYLTPYTLQATDVAQLKGAGITKLATMIAAPTAPAKWNPTFNPYNDTGAPPSYTTITTGTNVLQVPNTLVNAKLGAPLDAANAYVVFGFGQAYALIGKGVFEAPVHFEDGTEASPASKYQRFGLVFRLGVTLDKAEYVGAVAFHADELVGAATEISEYFKLTKP